LNFAGTVLSVIASCFHILHTETERRKFNRRQKALRRLEEGKGKQVKKITRREWNKNERKYRTKAA
jgi:hypothetical protein